MPAAREGGTTSSRVHAGSKNCLVGVCVLTYNSRELVENCLKSLQEALHDRPYCIVVVDNHSSDETAPFVRSTFPDVHVIESDSNVGYAQGNNIGAFYLLKNRDIEYLAFINPDVTIYADTLRSMEDAILNHPHAGCAGGAPVVNGKLWNEAFRNKPSFWQKLIIPGVLRHVPLFHAPISRLLRQMESAYFVPMEWLRSGTPVYCFSGACFLVSAVAFRTAGGFDPHTFLFQEEFILSERLRRAGYEVVAAPDALYAHVRHPSAKNRPVALFWHLVRSEQHLLRTYWRWRLPTRLAVYGYRLVETGIYGCWVMLQNARHSGGAKRRTGQRTLSASAGR